MKKRRFNTRSIAANTCGAIGYTAIVFVIALAGAIVMMRMVYSGVLEPLGIPTPTGSEALVDTISCMGAEDARSLQLPIFFQGAIAAGIAAVVLGVVLTLPYWLGRCVSRIIKWCVRFCKYKVTIPSLFIAKFLLAAVAVILTLGAGIKPLLTVILLTTVSTGLTAFILQYCLATSGEAMKAKDIW